MGVMTAASDRARRYSGRAVVLTAFAVLAGLIGAAMLAFTLATRPMERQRDAVDVALARAATAWSQRAHPKQHVNHVALLTRYETCATARVDYGANTPGREVRLRKQGGAWVVDEPHGGTLNRDAVPDERTCLVL